MRTRARNPFTTISTSGLLLPVDLLTRVIEGDPDLKGLSPKDYHLRSGERLNEAASRAWNECLAAWKSFRKKFAALPASDAGTTLTRDEWLLPLFQELGYGRLQNKKAIEIDGKEYPVSHGWENHVPIHLLSARLPLDRRTPGTSGAATRAPYSLLQELINRSGQHRWGFVSNGLKLFLLRDNAALARAANVEFDLEAMMDGELYADFMLLFLLCHQSRLEISEDGKPENCWLEKWANQADQQGTRAREKLRDGVETAIKSLGAGFLTTKGNGALRERLRSGELATQDYYRQLLRLVYRLLMLLVAEEKKTETGDNLLHKPGTLAEVRERYARFYSVSRIRTLAYHVFEGHAFSLLNQLVEFLQRNVRTVAEFEAGKMQRTDRPEYPFMALREGLMNALAHRDYSSFDGGMAVGVYPNRIEIWNSGSLPERLTVSALKRPHPSLPPNPDIAHVFYLRGLIERIGRGTITIVEDCKAAKLLAPSWTANKSGVTLTIFGRRSASVTAKLNRRQKELLAELRTGEMILPGDYYERMEGVVSQRQAQRDLSGLEDGGWLRQEGDGPATLYVRTEQVAP